MENRLPTRPTLLTLFITFIAVSGMIVPFAIPAAANNGTVNSTTAHTNSEGGEFSDHDDDEDDENRGMDYGPDYGIPENSFKIFFSDTEPPDEVEDEDQDEADDEDVELDDPEMGEGIRDLDEIESDNPGSQPDAWGESMDTYYYITPSMMQFYGWGLGDYRANQVEAIDWSSDKSLVLPDWIDETEEDGVIKEAYVGIIGIDGGAEPLFEGDDDDQYEKFIGQEGEVITYLDFELDSDETPDDIVDDPVTRDFGDRQTQERWTYHIEDHSTERDMRFSGDRIQHAVYGGNASGATGATFEYFDTYNTDVTFYVDGEVQADVYEYHWERERDRIYDERTTHVTDSKTVTREGSTYETAVVEHGPTPIGTPISAFVIGTCETEASDTTTKEVTRTWSELGGDREININEEVDIDVSGEISGGCAGVITGEAGPMNSTLIGGEITGNVSGVIDGGDFRTFEYDYWDHWNPPANSDEGGWDIQDTEHERTDTVEVDDSFDARITDNYPIDVEQVVVEVSENRYHSVVQIDRPGFDIHEDDIFVPSEASDSMNLWSLLMFGDDTFIESDWKSYSYTKYDTAGVYQEDCIYGFWDECYEPEPFPNHLGVYLFSQANGPDIVSTGESSNHNPELAGWQGTEVTLTVLTDDPDERHENARFDNDRPAYYHTFVAKNVPEPASSIISIHGTETEIPESSTRTVPYAEPDVRIDYDRQSDEVTIHVTGKDGEPLEGYDAIITGGGIDAEATTDENGIIHKETDQGINHIQVQLQGDDFAEITDHMDSEVFYGSVTAEKTIGFAGVVGHLYEAILQLVFAIPLVLLYLLWRDAELGL